MWSLAQKKNGWRSSAGPDSLAGSFRPEACAGAIAPKANDAALILAARTLGINLQKLHTRYEQQMDFDQGNDDPYAYR